MARFAYFGSAWTPHDPSYVCWVQHLTPELMRPPQLLRHPNRASSLVGVQYRGPRPLALKWCDQLVAAGAVKNPSVVGDQFVDLQLPNALITIAWDDTLSTVKPDALVLEFSDCAALVENCARLGLVVQKLAGGAFSVDLTQALGLHWFCKPTPVKGVTT